MRFLIILSLSAILFGQAQAQNGSDIRLRPIAFSHFENVDELSLRQGERDLGIMTVPTRHLTSETQVRVREFQFGIVKEEVFRPLGKVLLPEQGRDFILVMVPVKSGYRVFPVRADDPDFGGNDVCFFNFTPHVLLVALGETKSKIDPASYRIITPEPKDGSTIYKALFAYVKEGRAIPFNNSRWPVNGKIKSLVFVHWDQENERLTYRSVSLLAND